MRSIPATPSPAATVVLLREPAGRLEVLMVHRDSKGFFGGLVVFPGGGVDDIDATPLAMSVVSSDARDRVHRAAALRELIEEAGLMLIDGEAVPGPHSRGEDIYVDLRDRGIVLDGDQLTLVSRWVTPESAPRRFDARFYVAAVESHPPVRIDTAELTAYDWVTPAQALERYESGDWQMFLPTVAHLRWLERRENVADVLAAAKGADGRTLGEPRRMEDGSIVPLLLPVDIQ